MNEYEKILKKHYKRAAYEGFLRALVTGLASGCALAAALSILFYFLRADILWVSVTAGAAVAAVVTVILYFVKYRPTMKKVAAKVDKNGLKERMITMTEYEGDHSFMAEMQRKDAAAELAKMKDLKLKISVSVLSVTVCAIMFSLSVIATTVSALSFTGKVPAPDEIITPGKDETEYVEITYEPGDGGMIEGDLFQIVEKGGDCDEVMAVADDGYIFDIWSDGVTTPGRADKNVLSSGTVYANFIKIKENQTNTDKSDEAAGNVDSDKKPTDMPPAGGAAGKYEEYNQVIDGATYYRDVYREYYDEAMKILDEGGVVPEYIRKIIQEYYNVIL